MQSNTVNACVKGIMQLGFKPYKLMVSLLIRNTGFNAMGSMFRCVVNSLIKMHSIINTDCLRCRHNDVPARRKGILRQIILLSKSDNGSMGCQKLSWIEWPSFMNDSLLSLCILWLLLFVVVLQCRGILGDFKVQNLKKHSTNGWFYCCIYELWELSYLFRV